MTDPNIRAAIRHEMEQGRGALEDARALRQLGRHNGAVSRLYYALFHHVVALLLTVGVDPRRHASIPTLVGQHGLLGADEVAVVGRAFAVRQLADYERTWHATDAAIAPTFAEVEPLLASIEARLARDGWL